MKQSCERRKLQREILLAAALAPEFMSPGGVCTASSLIQKCQDHESFLRFCLRQRVFPTVFHNLEAVGGHAACPFLDKIRASLEGMARQWKVKRQIISRTSKNIADIFNMEKIPFVFLRGLALADNYYALKHHRFCQDIDVLVHYEYETKALEVLLDLGFRLNETHEEKEARAKYMGQIELIDQTNGISVDLNWLLTANCGIGRITPEMDDVWARTNHVAECQHALEPEDELIDVLRHAGQGHDFCQYHLRTCMDLSAFLRKRHSLDWGRVQEHAANLYSTRVVQYWAHFYTAFYRKYAEGENAPSFPECLLTEPVGLWEKRLFCSCTFSRHLRLNSRPQTGIFLFRSAFLAMMGKCWALDNLSQIPVGVLSLAFPTRELVLVMTGGCGSSILRRVVKYYCSLGIISPAILLGVVARLCSSIITPKRD